MWSGWEPDTLLLRSERSSHSSSHSSAFSHRAPLCHRHTERRKLEARVLLASSVHDVLTGSGQRKTRPRLWRSASISTRQRLQELSTNVSVSKTPAAGAAVIAASAAAALDPQLLQQTAGTTANNVVTPTDAAAQRTYLEVSEDVQAQPLYNRGRPLKINLDLLLWRCREQRTAAMLTLDSSKRRDMFQTLESNLKTALAMDPEDGRAYVSYGRLLIKQRRYEEARKLFADGCIATGNINPYIWCSWANLEFKLGSIARARKLFDAALVVDPNHVGAWHGWGMLEKSQGNYSRACDLWMKGIRNCKNQCIPYLYCSLAVLAADLGRVEEARAWFKEGTQGLGGKVSHVLWHAWAMMEAEKGDPSAVRYLFKKSLQCQPKSRYVHLAWAKFEQKQGNLAHAEQLLLRGISLNNTDPALYQALAVLQRQLGNVQVAREYFELGLQADASHIPLWQAYAMLEAAEGNLDRARELLQQGIWADPQHPDCVYVFQAWGTLEEGAENHAFARELYKCAIKVDPCNDAAWEAWIAMEEKLGALDKAVELRAIRRAGAYEFAVPANFTTRRDESLTSSFSSFLSNWFQDFSSKRSSPKRARTLREFLPADFQDELRVEDVIVDLDPLKLAEAKAQRAKQTREVFSSYDEEMVAEFKLKQAEQVDVVA